MNTINTLETFILKNVNNAAAWLIDIRLLWLIMAEHMGACT